MSSDPGWLGTARHGSARHGSASEALKQLLEKCLPDTTRLQGEPPRPGAACFSNPLMSDVESDWSPLHDAAHNGRVLALQRLLAQGTRVNLSTLDRVSPLHAACSQGHAACAKLLVERGANVNGSTVDGHTPLSEACACGHVTCVSLLLQHGATPLGNTPTSSPLHRAAARGHSEVIQPLVQHGADVDQFIAPSGFPLHVACSHQHLSSVRKLLQLGATVNSRVSGASPLHVAAGLADPELVSLLLEHGADRGLRDSEGRRPADAAPPDSAAGRLLRQAGGAPPPLLQLCRLHIRNTAGKQRLGAIHHLPLPAQVKQYLLYQEGPLTVPGANHLTSGH